MAKLLEYKEIKDKEKFFQNGAIKIVVNVDAIFAELDKLAATGDFIFRGLSEAKYKMYNSAQRYYLNNELFRQVKAQEVSVHYDAFVDTLIDECKSWNSETVKKLLAASDIDEENSLAYLSFMQHFGVPTPFLDFTFDPYMALLFAIDGVNYVPSDVEIDNYFSIYYTYQNETMFEGWRHTFNTNGQNLNKGKITYTEVNKNSMHILLPTDEPYKILNNTNIINQKGLFFYNNHPGKPLEEAYLEFAAKIKEKLGENKFKEMLMLDTFANCFNIHKSLIPYIREKLRQKGITPAFAYPDFTKMKSDILAKSVIRNLNTNKRPE